MKKFYSILTVIVLFLFCNISVVSSAYAEETIQNEQAEQEELVLDENGYPEDMPPPKQYTQEEYQQVYQDLEVPTFNFIHGIDPDQYYDMKDTAWSPYPLMRLNSPIYFKSVTIMPGYYLLTPRQYKGDWYILFKEAGKVKYIIPVFEKCFHEPTYYHTHLKELDMRKSQRFMVKFLNGIGKIFKNSKRRPATQTNIELTDLDNKFLLIELHYAQYCYKCIFRAEKL